jgi:DNA-binding FrmR family transcriptional regulator
MTEKVSLPIFADELQQGLLDRLNRVEGQVRGIVKMVEAKVVLRNYLERCATDSIRSGDTAVYDELMEAIYKFVK